MSLAIKVENISKKYKLRTGQRYAYLTFRDALTNFARLPFDLIAKKKSLSFLEKNEFWALKDISFEVKQGEVVGIIGQNGAGKSTLLKILTGITEPTKGRAVIYGKVGSLLEVGTGFHPELSGRENVFLNGAILGMGKKEIQKKFNEIVAFAEVEKFIDMPVKRYSSGMQVRLAFAVAAHLEPEILLVDEVLAVGDAKFQKKSLGKMREVTEEAGRTILFVSHNMDAVKKLCTKTILLHQGKIIDYGPTEKIINTYLNSDAKFNAVTEYRFNKRSIKKIQIRKISILNKILSPCNRISISENFFIKVEYQALEPAKDLFFSIFFYSQGEVLLFSSETDGTKKTNNYDKGMYETIVEIPSNLFNIGQYYFTVSIHYANMKPLEYKENINFEILDINHPKSLIPSLERTGKIAIILNYQTSYVG